jgi:hypothetical protein
MLGALEQRLLGLVSDALAGRDQLAIGPAGASGEPEAGSGAVRIGLTTLRPITGFEPRMRPAPPGTDDTRRMRPLRLAFEASIDVSQRPAADGEDALIAARRLALDDLSLIGHALDAPELRDGAAFLDGDADPGFLVTEFSLESGAVPAIGADGIVRGGWVYAGHVEVWPPGGADEVGLMATVTIFGAAQPMAIDLDDPAVAVGGTTTIRVRGLAGRRQRVGADAPVEQRLAVRVASRLSAAKRGSISSGEAGTGAGVRLVAVGTLETILEYHAPASLPTGAPVERVEVFLARTDGRIGLLLGSIVVPLLDVS